MELSDLTNQIERQGIKKGNPVEVTAHPDSGDNLERKYKSIGYFDKVSKEYPNPELRIKQYKNHESLPGMRYDSDSFNVFDVVRIRKLK